VREAGLIDPHPTLRELGKHTGLSVEDLIHYALVKFVASGSEAIMVMSPTVVRELATACRNQDWRKVRGMIEWVEAGL